MQRRKHDLFCINHLLCWEKYLCQANSRHVGEMFWYTNYKQPYFHGQYSEILPNMEMI